MFHANRRGTSMVRWLPLVLLGLLSVSSGGAAAFAQAGAAATTAEGATVLPESWADPGLPVRRGLALWLDASSLNAARKAHGIAEAFNGTRIETWYDGSGHRRDLTQGRAQAQPLFIEAGLRFDGQASFLERAGLKMSLEDFTLFVVAAPLLEFGRLPRLSRDARARPRRLHVRRDCRYGLWVHGAIRRAQRRGERLRRDGQPDG